MRAPGSRSGRPMILIVDDERGVTDCFARILRLKGYDVHVAYDADAGLRDAEALDPDLVVLDLRMPAVSGQTFLTRLRAHQAYRHTPVAIITGDYAVSDDVERKLDALGAELYFKPLWAEDLLGIVRRLLGSEQAEQASTRVKRCHEHHVEGTSPSTDRHRLNLLLVDDCLEERTFYEFALEREFEVLTASRGEEGVALAFRTHPDVIVLDVNMPEVSGWEACARIKRDPATSNIPVIFLTGADAPGLHEQATAVGALTLLTKPCPVERLRNTILHAVAGD